MALACAFVLLGQTGLVRGENKDWLAWFAASVFTIFFLLKAATRSPPLQAATQRFFVVLWAIGLTDAIVVRWWRVSSWSDFGGSLALLFASTVVLVRALRPFASASRPVSLALTAITLLYAVTRLSFWHKGFLGPLTQWSDAVLPGGLIAACLFLPRVFSSDPPPNARPWRSTLIAIGAFGLLSVFTPIEPYTAAHHWSFYLGPVDLVRAGGHLLHSVPSQYGFGSILALTLLPFDSVTSLYLAVWGSTLAFAALTVWNALKCFGPSPGLKGIAVAGVFAAVYVLPGWVLGASGIFSCPSVTGFRFLWSALIAVWIPSLYSEPKPFVQKLLFSFTVGWASLWAFESFLYTTAVVGFSLVGAMAFSMRSGSFKPLRVFGERVGVPALIGLGSAVAITYLVYQVKWGLWPDVYAFIEFPRAYSNGFGALGIAWHAAAVFLGFVAWALGFSCVLAVERGGSPNQAPSLNSFAAMGYTLGVLTYFISRSHDNNALNLVPSILLALSMAVPELPREPLSRLAVQTKPVIRALWFLTIAFSLALGLRYFPLQKQPPLLGLDRTLIEAQIPPGERAIVEAIRAHSARGGKFSAAPDGPDLFSSTFLPFIQGLPVAPAAEYSILDPERQAEYLDRWGKLSAPHELLVLWPTRDCQRPPAGNPFGSHLEKKASSVGPCETYGAWSLQRYEMR